MNNKKELFEQYKKSKKKFKNQLKFIKDGLSVESVQTLRFATLRRVEKK